MGRKEGEEQMDFFERQDSAEPDFIPLKKDEEWRLRQSGEDIARLAEFDYKKEVARKKIIVRKTFAKIKKMLEEKK